MLGWSVGPGAGGSAVDVATGEEARVSVKRPIRGQNVSHGPMRGQDSDTSLTSDCDPEFEQFHHFAACWTSGVWRHSDLAGTPIRGLVRSEILQGFYCHTFENKNVT